MGSVNGGTSMTLKPSIWPNEDVTALQTELYLSFCLYPHNISFLFVPLLYILLKINLSLVQSLTCALLRTLLLDHGEGRVVHFKALANRSNFITPEHIRHCLFGSNILPFIAAK